MKEKTKQILAALDIAPTLFQGASRLRKELDAAPTEELAEKQQQFGEIFATLLLIQDFIRAVPDHSIQKMLRSRAVLGIPWSKIRSENGADSLKTCGDYIDAHFDEITDSARKNHSASVRLLCGVRKEG